MSLEGKVAIVTGGTRGIGRAIVMALAQHGCRVVLTYRSSEEAARALEETWPERVLAHRHDAHDFAGAQQIVAFVCETFGGVDMLVNNVGILANALLVRMSEEEWDVSIATNLKGVFNFTRAVLPSMLRRRWGRVVNIASVGGLQGMVGQTNYCASKAGVIGFTRALARETARSHITVNAIAPGFIETDMMQSIPDAYRKQALQSIPMGHFGATEDIAEVVLFLLSDAARYITGQVIPVDGGLTA